jgi:hypothetical protein
LYEAQTRQVDAEAPLQGAGPGGQA